MPDCSAACTSSVMALALRPMMRGRGIAGALKLSATWASGSHSRQMLDKDWLLTDSVPGRWERAIDLDVLYNQVGLRRRAPTGPSAQ